MVHKQKNTKKLFKVWKLGVQNFAFLDTYGHLALLRPNPLCQLPQILHTTCHVPGASSCKISGHMAKFRLLFWLKIPKKCPKNVKKWFFSHNCQITSLSITRFGINGLDLNIYLHEKFHWPVISRFFKIQFWIFSKFCIFIFETHF